jgi:hypothetical protein
VLWVCSSAIEQTPGTDDDDVGWAGVFEYDLTTRLPIERYVLSNRRVAHLFGDLAVARGGAVYVTDALEGSIYRLDGAAGTFERWIHSEGWTPFASPQGIVFSRDERHLFVADYSYGVFRIGVEDREVRLLPYPDDLAIVGIDGLARHGRDLIAIQNGVKPHRVIRLGLDDARGRIVEWETLQANLPGSDEPTLGVVVGDRGGWGADFYYIANSHWGAFDRQGRLREDARLTPPLIFRLRLD